MDSLSSNSSHRKYPKAPNDYTFIYGLVDPRKREKIRYVGKTDNLRKRMAGHIRDSRRKGRRRPVEYWIRKLLHAGVRPEYVILELIPAERWEEAEKYWIVLYRFRYHDLLNVSEGGDQGPPPECCSRGEARPNAKLTEELVVEMRTLRSQGISISALAEKYGVDNAVVVKTCHGDMWKHVGGPLTRYPHVGPKLTDKQAIEIRILRSQGMTDHAVAEKFGVDESVVSLVCRGKTHKNAGGPLTIGAHHGLIGGHKGDTHRNAKLTNERARQMREMYATGKYTCEQLADLFGIGLTTTEQVLRFRTWKEAGGPMTIGTHRGKRNNQGEENTHAKLTSVQVEQIRAMYGTGNYSQAQLAKMFGVDPSSISNIINYQSWKSVGDPISTSKEDHPRTSLMRTRVEQIREMYATGYYNQTQLARMFGLDPSSVCNIVNFKCWK